MAIDVRDFELDVVQRSADKPVVVDFWAEWCGPCRVLGPVLEKLEQEGAGAWVLAKVNVDILQEPAVRYGVSGIPAVKMFVDGKPSAEFVGAIPEASVRQWLAKNLPSSERQHVEDVKQLLASGRDEQATALLKEILSADPQNPEARVLLARQLVFSDPATSLELVRDVTDPKAIELAGAVETLAHLVNLAGNPSGLPAGASRDRYRMAIGRLIDRDYSGALTGFIELIRDDRYYDDDGSRKACIAIFKYLGEDHPITIGHRRDFSSALY